MTQWNVKLPVNSFSRRTRHAAVQNDNIPSQKILEPCQLLTGPVLPVMMQHRDSRVFGPTCSGVLGQAWCCSTLDICTPLALVSVEGFQCIPLWHFLLALPPNAKQGHMVDCVSTIWFLLIVRRKQDRLAHIHLQGQCTWPWDVRRGQGRRARWI